ncbi:MAG: transporter substrate-binding protein [Burkholderia sp.]|jgi:quinoprotein dehydrogenase-associated probable ABC transporter substrate-binding protein|nr:transporter substrate-binding protein [Burkholderia sp.]
MSLHCRELVLPLLLAASAAQGGETERVLRVCADPDNLPYSHQDLSGFENRIAAIAADELHAKLQYDWLPQRRGFVTKTMGAGLCDVFIGVPAGMERVLTTRPYYRSSYVFAWRRGDDAPHSFADPQITRRKVGVQLVGNDLAATPPGYALARAGAVANVVGYTVYGDGPAAQRMVDALADGTIDTALLWGPQAGYFASHASRPIALAIAQRPAGLATPFDFGIAMGVARGNRDLRDELDGVLQRRRNDIDKVLAEYAVPRTDIDTEAP